jgi:DNA-binding FadR family transcriptional regulator
MTAPTYAIDRYVVDTLLTDLVGHDRSAAAFLVYLVITAAAGEGKVALSHARLAERTGLSRRSVQAAVTRLERRRLIEVTRAGPTETLRYHPLTPWRRG